MHRIAEKRGREVGQVGGSKFVESRKWKSEQTEEQHRTGNGKSCHKLKVQALVDKEEKNRDRVE